MNSSREFDTYIFIYIFRDILKVNRSHKHAHLQFTANFQSSIIPKKKFTLYKQIKQIKQNMERKQTQEEKKNHDKKRYRTKI